MKELLTELDESLNNLKLLPQLSTPQLYRSYSHEVNQHPQISFSKPLIDCGTQIIQNKQTKQLLQKATHHKENHSKFFQKLSSKNSLHTHLDENTNNILSKSQCSDNKQHNKPSPLNNITIYNLEVFNVSSNDMFKQNNDHSNLYTNQGHVYNSFYLSPRIDHSSNRSNRSNLLEPNYVHRVKKHKSTHQPKSNNKLYTFNSKTLGCEETTDSIKNTCIHNNSIKQQSSSRNNNTNNNNNTNGRNNTTFEIIVSRQENSSDSIQSNNSSTSSKHGKNLTNIKKIKMYKKKSNKSKITQNNLNVNESNLCEISKIHLSKTNKSSFRNINQFNTGNSTSNNLNNISSSMLHTNPRYLITNDRISAIDGGCSESDQDDNTSINKRSMNRLRLTNIFNPCNMVNVAPSEFNAISHSSETEISNIFIQPTQSLINKQTDSHRSSFIYKQPSLNNKSQYQHSKSNKNDRRNRKLCLTNNNNNNTNSIQTSLSYGFIKGSRTIAKYLSEFMEKINAAQTSYNHKTNNNNFIIYPQEISSIKGISAFSYTNQKKTNEDKLCICLNQHVPNSDKTAHFLGIYDGHCGSSIAELLCKKAHNEIIEHPLFLTDTITAIKESLIKIDNDILTNNMNMMIDSIDKSGTCVLLMIIVNECMYFANIGDSRSIIGIDSGMKIASLTVDHKPNEPNEEKRILQCGGKIEGFLKNIPGKKLQRMVYRTNPGFLSVSRSIGDVLVKVPYFNGKSHIQISIPDIFVLKYDKDFDFIILASDGIFDELNNTQIACEVYNTAKDIIEDNGSYEDFLKYAVINIMKYAIEMGASDNLSIIFIAFDNMKKNIDKRNVDKINAAISRLENTLMDNNKLYNGFENKYQYVFDMKDVNQHELLFEGIKNNNAKENSLYQTSFHNKSFISTGKTDYDGDSKGNIKIEKCSFVSKLKGKLCCGIFS